MRHQQRRRRIDAVERAHRQQALQRQIQFLAIARCPAPHTPGAVPDGYPPQIGPAPQTGGARFCEVHAKYSRHARGRRHHRHRPPPAHTETSAARGQADLIDAARAQCRERAFEPSGLQLAPGIAARLRAGRDHPRQSRALAPPTPRRRSRRGERPEERIIARRPAFHRRQRSERRPLPPKPQTVQESIPHAPCAADSPRARTATFRFRS